jgi:hypothetical protein
MGVITKKFGPSAWITLESLSTVLDVLISHGNTRKTQEKTIRLFMLIGFVLPCVHCRISYRSFTNPECPENMSTDIARMVMLKDGVKKLVYNIHARVNKKLMNQELDSVHSPKEKQQISEKWSEYVPTYEQALKNRYFTVESKEFWNCFTRFLAYVVSDMPKDHYTENEKTRKYHIVKFVKLVGTILSDLASIDPDFKRLANTYFKSMSALSILSDSLDNRITAIWIVRRDIYKLMGWDIEMKATQFVEKIKSSIVGCTKSS